MKIKLYIVTYNNTEELNKTLNSCYQNSGDICKEINFEIYIINNHSNFNISSQHKVDKIYHNTLRPDFSTGYLSRNWNQALILGFKDLNNPDCDIVCMCQDDTEFKPNWIQNLVDSHKKYSFITCGWGDNFMSFTAEGVKRIGIFDERFPFGGVAPEYFLRALKFNKEKSSINDYHHGRILNKLKVEIADRPNIPIGHAKERKTNKDLIENMFIHKYPFMKHCSQGWKQDLIDNTDKIIFGCKSYILYPYFEKNIETLKKQRYL